MLLVAAVVSVAERQEVRNSRRGVVVVRVLAFNSGEVQEVCDECVMR